MTLPVNKDVTNKATIDMMIRLVAIGIVLVGIPAAGIWAALVLFLAIIQLPPIIILGPIAAWVFTFAGTTPSVIFLVWALIVYGYDGFLKPVLMGRGVDAPCFDLIMLPLQ